MADDDPPDRLTLVALLQQDAGSLEEAEHWLEQLKATTPWFSSSDHMLHLETSIRARRVEEHLITEMGERLPREHLIALVQKLLTGHGTEEQQWAWLSLLERNVSDPEVSNLIFWSDEELTAEEIVDRALAYQPIIVGPASYHEPPG